MGKPEPLKKEPIPPEVKPAIDNKIPAPTAEKDTKIEKKVDEKSAPLDVKANAPQNDKKSEPLKNEPTPPSVKPAIENKTPAPTATNNTKTEKKVDEKSAPLDANANTPQNDKKPEPVKKEPTTLSEKPVIDNKTIAP